MLWLKPPSQRRSWLPLGRTRPASPLLYVRCDGCREVTAHLTYRLTRVRGLAAAPGGPLCVYVSEIVCSLCGYAQPRVLGDRLPPDVSYVCDGRRTRLRRAGRRCARTFGAPAAAPWPTCPWCGTVAGPVTAG